MIEKNQEELKVFKDFFEGISDMETDEEIGKKVQKVVKNFRA